MAASSIYRAGGSPTRFQHQFAAGPTHYTTTVEPMHHLRYNSFAIDGHQVPLPSTPPSRTNNNNNMMALNGMRPPPGATLGLLGSSAKLLYMPPPPQEPQQQQQQQTPPQQYLQYPASSSAVRHSSPIYSSAPSPLFMNPMLAKSYQQTHMSLVQPTEVLMVSPGVPTPLELSIYEIKQPTGFLHVTVGNQTVEFLDGVANMPHKR